MAEQREYIDFSVRTADIYSLMSAIRTGIRTLKEDMECAYTPGYAEICSRDIQAAERLLTDLETAYYAQCGEIQQDIPKAQSAADAWKQHVKSADADDDDEPTWVGLRQAAKSDSDKTFAHLLYDVSLYLGDQYSQEQIKSFADYLKNGFDTCDINSIPAAEFNKAVEAWDQSEGHIRND
jgi:hypothetical protein